MAHLTLEERVAALEAKVTHIEANGADKTTEPRGWKSIVGIFENDPEFEEAMRLGREYRESLRPVGDEDAPLW